MQKLLWLHSKLLLVLLAGVLLCNQAVAVTPCTDLPPSVLRVYDLKAPTVQTMEVPEAALERNHSVGGVISRHTLMLTVSEVAAWFEIGHRIVSRPDGSVCDAPTLVRLGFGSRRRLAFLASNAAMDTCVRQKMLSHETAHSRAFDDVVDQFIDEQQDNFQRGMAALKQTPAATAQLAKARWEAGLRAIITEAKRQLVVQMSTASAHIDEPSALAALEDACGGKIRQLEQRSG